MAKHSAQVTINTEDNKALRMVCTIMRPKRGDKKDHLWKSIYKQLAALHERIENGLLDLDTALGEGKESWDS